MLSRACHSIDRLFGKKKPVTHYRISQVMIYNGQKVIECEKLNNGVYFVQFLTNENEN